MHPSIPPPSLTNQSHAPGNKSFSVNSAPNLEKTLQHQCTVSKLLAIKPGLSDPNTN